MRKAKWLHDADSPVMLMIDDFSNAWQQKNGCTEFDTRGDWGGGHRRPDSILSFLEKRLFVPFPEIRTTFFLIVGSISQYTSHQPFTFAEAIDYDNASIEFFKDIFTDPRFEIAYHGLNHGKPGRTTADFVQEWKGFVSLDEGLTQIREGMELYQKVLGTPPRGGKYGGWECNAFSDDTIDLSGFRWWCRDWTPKDVTGVICTDYYEPQIFGRSHVVALPSTVHGRQWSKRQIDRLLEEKQIISIEEHIGALRPDGLIQTPNVYDDISRLRSLFTYLRGKNVWYATASEIADYVTAYMDVSVSDITVDSFRLRCPNAPEGSMITLLLQPSGGVPSRGDTATLLCPDGRTIRSEPSGTKNVFRFNLSVAPGIYYLEGC